MLTIGSLFSGIGGLELGLERAGLGPVLWQVEREPFCREVLARHWPQAARHDDVRAVGAAQLARADVICGGFPCQDLSAANPGGRGLEGERSGLWFEYLRIVSELGPRFVIVENVPRLVGRGLDIVVAGLDGLGYAVVGTRLSASDVGAPHKRERLFLVAHADSDGPQGVEAHRAAQGAALRGARGGPGMGAVPVLRGRGVRVQRARGTREPLPVRAPGDVGADALPAHAWAAEPAVGRVAPRLPGDVARLRALGNAVVPQCAEIVGRLVRQVAEGEVML